MPNPTSSTMNHHGPSSLANGILFYAEKSTLKGKNLDIYSNIFPNPPPVVPFFPHIHAKVSRYLGQLYITPHFLKNIFICSH